MRSIAILVLALGLGGCQSGPTHQTEAPAAETKTKQFSEQAPQPVSQPAGPQQAPEQAATSTGAPPDTILIQSPYGNVTFTHKKHYERVNSDCSTCHPKVFQQSLAPLNYKKALHRSAEASMTSCAYCHSIGNSAFAADSNCTKCHALREH
jgi:c(7)-type cytochrome triheme protein